MNIFKKLYYKLPGTGDYYTQKALIWRNRGDGFALEILDATRISYKDKPNEHRLSSGEKLPAVPKDYVNNLVGVGSYFCGVEGKDDQLVIFKPDFQVDHPALGEDSSDFSKSDLDGISLETDMHGEELKQRLLDKNRSAVNFAVLDSRDERFTFFSEALKNKDKYGAGIWSVLSQNAHYAIPIIMAVAVAIIMSQMGDPSALAEEMRQSVQKGVEQGFSNVSASGGVSGSGAPPGQ